MLHYTLYAKSLLLY
jgi:acyl-CoA oxidase